MKIRKRIKRIIMVFIFLGFIFCTLYPMKMSVSPEGTFNKNRLLVEYEQTGIGPEFSIIKGNEALAEYYSNRIVVDEDPVKQKVDFPFNEDDITLIGDNPLNKINYNSLTEASSQFIVEGILVNTEEYNEELVPVFYVERWYPTSYITYLYSGKSKVFFRVWLILGILSVIEIIYIIIRFIYILFKKLVTKYLVKN